jgi:hypothetical protein
MKMTTKHWILLIVLLIGSDLLIGAYGHYVGTGESDIVSYITSEETHNELILVFVVAIVVIFILRYGLKVG